MVNLDLPICTFNDHLEARRVGRQAAYQLGMSSAGQTLVATIISELARNMLQHEGGGVLTVRTEGSIITIEAKDEGTRLEELRLALTPGYSTRDGAYFWLPGIARVADRLELIPGNPHGVVIRVALSRGRRV